MIRVLAIVRMQSLLYPKETINIPVKYETSIKSLLSTTDKTRDPQTISRYKVLCCQESKAMAAVDSRVVKPEHRVEAGVRYITHVALSSHLTVYNVMQIFQAILDSGLPLKPLLATERAILLVRCYQKKCLFAKVGNPNSEIALDLTVYRLKSPPIRAADGRRVPQHLNKS